MLAVTHFQDLKPENLLFRTPAEDADIMVADFGLSRVMDNDKLKTLTEICGTPGVRSLSCTRGRISVTSLLVVHGAGDLQEKSVVQNIVLTRLIALSW
jgi:hypothetical protein